MDAEQVAFDVLLCAREEWQEAVRQSAPVAEQALARWRYLRTLLHLMDKIHSLTRPE